MFRNAYKNKVVLVTGDTGFKGSWLAIWLKQLGAEVIGFSLEPPSDPSNYIATKLGDKIIHVHGDIRDITQLIAVFSKYQPEFVFHLAAQPIVSVSYEDPKLTFETNVSGTVNVLECVRLTSSVKVLLNITSDKCYDTASTGLLSKECMWGYRETDPMGGRDPYSASKGCAELVFGAYLKSFFFKTSVSCKCIGAASVRSGNVFGGGDWGRDRLLPDCVRAFHNQQVIGIRNPNFVRPWQFVLEPLCGYLWLGALLREDPIWYSGAWNFGPDDSHISVAKFVEQFIYYWGEGSWKPVIVKNPFYETSLLKLNCDKAHIELNWWTVLNFDAALKMASDWYKSFYEFGSGKDMYDICVKQIQQYSDRAVLKSLLWVQE